VVRGTRHNFSPNIVIEVVHLSQAPVNSRLLCLLSPYHQHVIDMFNTCHRLSLIDTGGGYNLGAADLAHHTPRPSQPAVSPFHQRTPSGLRLSMNLLPSELNGDQALILMSGCLHSTSNVTNHLSIA
jgi:hypothetical protein